MSLDAISARARQFKRHAARWSARVEAHADHAEQFRLSFADQFNDLAVVDVSEGGFGLVTSFLVPKNLKLIVHVDAAAVSGRTLLIRGVTRRCALMDHRPCFQVGVQFMDASGADERELVKLAKSAQASPAALVGAEVS